MASGRTRTEDANVGADIRPEWFLEEDVVGLTAGTSTPDTVIDAVEARLDEIAAAVAQETQLVTAP